MGNPISPATRTTHSTLSPWKHTCVKVLSTSLLGVLYSTCWQVTQHVCVSEIFLSSNMVTKHTSGWPVDRNDWNRHEDWPMPSHYSEILDVAKPDQFSKTLGHFTLSEIPQRTRSVERVRRSEIPSSQARKALPAPAHSYHRYDSDDKLQPSECEYQYEVNGAARIVNFVVDAATGCWWHGCVGKTTGLVALQEREPICVYLFANNVLVVNIHQRSNNHHEGNDGNRRYGRYSPVITCDTHAAFSCRCIEPCRASKTALPLYNYIEHGTCS